MNNRELSLLIWSLIIIVIFLFQKGVRQSMVGVIKAFFAWKLSISYLAMLTYIFSAIFILRKIGFWNLSILKETVIWICFTGLIMLVNSNKVNKESNYFRKIVFDNLKIVVIIEFITNAYSFSFLVELIVMPILIFLVILNVYASYYEEHKKVKVVLDYVLIILGLIFLTYAIVEISENFNNFTTLNNLRAFLIAPILTFLYLPFMYFMALFMSYEVLFVRINVIHRNNDDLKSSLKKNIFKACLINLSKLNRFSSDMRIYEIEKNEDIASEIQRLNFNK